ncbi:MAG: S8 family serine peptidase [Rhodobacteraceae bacterium]|nr:S8 family serine peptidase [Paracoccaceae bacterium]
MIVQRKISKATLCSTLLSATLRPAFARFALVIGLIAGALAASSAPGHASTDEVLRMVREQARNEGKLNLGQPRGVDIIVKLRAKDGSPVYSDNLALAKASIRQARRDLATDLQGTGIGIGAELSTLPFVAASVTESQLMNLLASDSVDGVFLNRKERKAQVTSTTVERAALASSVPSIDVAAAWAAGYDGEGLTVAVIDGGFRTVHPMLAGKVVQEACFALDDPDFDTFTRCPSGQVPEIGSGAASNCPPGSDRCDHGTHVASIAVGNDGTNFGVARGAKLLPIDVFSRVESSDDCDPDPVPCELTDRLTVLKALDYVNEVAEQYNIVAVNLSIGGSDQEGSCDDDPRAEVVAMLRKKGIATTIAAGNSGATGAVNTPACITAAVAVGATNDGTTVASFSNFSNLVDVMAPGVSITAADGRSDGLRTLQGTSMAAPHVAGAFALLRDAAPDKSLDELENALKVTGARTTRLDSGIFVPRIRVNRAILHLEGRDRRVFNNVMTSSAGTNVQGDSFLRFHNDSAAPGTVTVSLRDADTGRALGTWTSPQIAPHASMQFAINRLETDATVAANSVSAIASDSRQFFNLEVESNFPGYMQHIVWARSVGALTNLSACADGLAKDNEVLLNVHTTGLADYPSRIRIANTGATAESAQLAFYGASTGKSIASWTSPQIPAGGSIEVTMAQIEAATPALSNAVSDGTSQVNVNLGRLTGYLQHVVQNSRAGVLLDLSPKCELGTRD